MIQHTKHKNPKQPLVARIPHAAFEILQTYGPDEFSVYCVLIKRADFHTGKCYGKNKPLAEEAGVSVSTVQRCVKRLKEAGFISVWKQGQVNNFHIKNLEGESGRPTKSKEVGQRDLPGWSERPTRVVSVTYPINEEPINEEPINEEPPCTPPKTKDAYAFGELWTSYPRRDNGCGSKREAEAAFSKIAKRDLPLLKKALANYVAAKSKTGATWPKDASTWLRKDRWREWIEPEPDAPKPSPNPQLKVIRDISGYSGPVGSQRQRSVTNG